MNIAGVGIDVVNVARIQSILEIHPERFKEKVFTDAEADYAIRKSNGDLKQMATILAARWAGKEAVAKALGTGFGDGLFWSNVEIISDGGPPTVRLIDVPTELAQKKFMLSLSHDYPTAAAIAMLLA